MSNKIPMEIKHVYPRKDSVSKSEFIALILAGIAETISRIYPQGIEIPTEESTGLDKLPDITFPKVSTVCCFSSEMHLKHKMHGVEIPRKMHTHVIITFNKGGVKKHFGFNMEQEF